MRLWLIYRQKDVKKNEWYIKEYQTIGLELGFMVELILAEDITVVCKMGGYDFYHRGQITQLPDAAIIRTIDPKLSKVLEAAKIRCFNSAQISELCNDKAKTCMEVAKLNIAMIPTTPCRREDLEHTIGKVAQELVIKTVDGHGGQEVFLLPSVSLSDPEQVRLRRELVLDCLQKTNSDFVIQPLIGLRHQDLRVYVLGKQILCAILRTSSSGFKANYSLGGLVTKYELSEKEKEIVFTILTRFDVDLVGIDFLVSDDGELIFNEMEDVVGTRMLYECTDINLVREYLIYIKSQLLSTM